MDQAGSCSALLFAGLFVLGMGVALSLSIALDFTSQAVVEGLG